MSEGPAKTIEGSTPSTSQASDAQAVANVQDGAAAAGSSTKKDVAHDKHSRFALDWREVGKHVLFALLVGIVTGLASVLLCLCVGWSYDLFQLAKWLVWFLPIAGVLELLLYKAFKLPGDLTTHRVVMNILADKPISYLLAPGILIGTCMSIVCGGSVGKEAGALQMGSSLGALVGKPFKMRSVYKRNADEPMDGYSSATGMAACFSALFFAPLGAAMFVFELARFKRSVLKHAGTVLIACFVAFLVSSTIGIGDIINKVEIPAMDWHVVGQVVVIGVAAALAGTIFDNAIQWIHDLTWRITHNLYVWVVVGGLAFACLVTFFGWDHFTGSGGNILNEALAGSFGPWDFAIKLLLTCICLAFWLKGGEIMPSFCIGGLLGAACSYITGGSPEFGAAMGVMGFFAAFSRCPLAAFLMGCEIFGWGMAPFLAIGVAVAFMFGSPVGFYGEGVDRALRTRWNNVAAQVRHKRFQESDELHERSIASGNAAEPGVGYVGALHNAEDVGEMIEEALESTKDKTEKPS